MQILVTDATDTVGRLVARQLIAAGHAVSAVAEWPHPSLDPRVELVRAPLSDPVLQELVTDADVVIHLAPVDDTAPGCAGIEGVAHVAHAAARAGARLFYLSQAAGSPGLHRPAEELVSTSWGPSLVVRAAPLVGRQLDWMVCRTVASLLRTRISKVSERPMRVLHLDDLVRFLVHALDTDRTGTVDLATPDTVNVITAWRLLRSVDPRSRLHRVQSWPELLCEMDLSALRENWNFEFGWHASEAVADTARGLVGRRLNAAGAVSHGIQRVLPVEVPPRVGPPDELYPAAPEGLEGEFDDRIDPRFPIFSATTLAEALPGPLTPITLDIQLNGLRTASRVVGQVLALGSVIGDEWDSRAVGVFGHRPYIGVSANVVAASQLPGWDQQAIARRALGDQAKVGPLVPYGRPRLAGGALGSIAKAVVAARSLNLSRHLRADTRAYAAAAHAERLDSAQLTAVPDACLEVRVSLLRDRIHQGWILTVLWLVDGGVTAAALQRTKTGSSVSGYGVLVESNRIAAETRALAALLRRNPPLLTLAQEGDVAGLRALSPPTAAVLDAAVARIGHRGPGEAELASPVFADRPDMLLTAAAAAAHASPKAPPPPAKLPAAGARGSREQAYDTTIYYTHEMRKALRELGCRRAGSEVIDAVDDVCYLTCDELVTMPADARLRIKRRRAERERLQAQHPPDIIERSWLPVNGRVD